MSDEIVLGYDGSDGGKAALNVACGLAKKLGSKIVIAYAYEVSAFGGEVQDLGKELHERGEALNAEAAAAAAQQGVESETLIERGEKADALARVAADRNAAMIVVGSRGERPLKGVVLGSVSQKLLHLSETPVLVVPLRKG
ncbi:MAG TPA: universal stress protein [Thermoleophilaceae bacterium]|jgi:nucleotide-binding universal stress UspA family protein